MKQTLISKGLSSAATMAVRLLFAAVAAFPIVFMTASYVLHRFPTGPGDLRRAIRIGLGGPAAIAGEQGPVLAEQGELQVEIERVVQPVAGGGTQADPPTTRGARVRDSSSTNLAASRSRWRWGRPRRAAGAGRDRRARRPAEQDQLRSRRAPAPRCRPSEAARDPLRLAFGGDNHHRTARTRGWHHDGRVDVAGPGDDHQGGERRESFSLPDGLLPG